MKKKIKVNDARVMFLAVFFLSCITVLFITEFRYLKDIMTNYQESIRQLAENKTNFFLDNSRAVTREAAKKLTGQNKRDITALKELLSFDPRVTGAYILDERGRVLVQTSDEPPDSGFFSDNPPGKLPRGETRVLGVHTAGSGQIVLAVVTPMGKDWLAVDFNIKDFQQEFTMEFLGDSCKVALFDNQNHLVVWPFDHQLIGQFTGREKNFFSGRIQYDVSSLRVGQPAWQLFFFLRENNFDNYRIITVMFLLFVLYCCLYQFLVELWGVNSANSYFENIDFNIFNYVNEGVIISNNAGKIIFGNKSAHEIFIFKKELLKGTKLKEILGHIGDAQDEKNKYGSLILKTPDRLLKAIHSPIYKNGKVLGSLTVIGSDRELEKICGETLSRLIKALPQGIIFLDRNHKVLQANLMARCYMGALNPGMSVDAVDPELGSFIFRNIGSQPVMRVQLTSLNITCEVIYTYDDYGSHTGTLVLIGIPEDEPRNIPGTVT